MAFNSSTYNVTGRYMSGTEVVAYHLVGNNGDTLDVNKDKAILMTSRGLIENMRVQYSGDNVIIRGKGTNLNTLPVFDINKSTLRSNNNKEVVSGGNVNKNNNQIKIIKRIMYKTSCVGYEIIDANGNTSRINRDKATKLAIDGRIVNAEAQKYKPTNGEESRIVLRGIGCDIKNLPVIIVDQNGREVDTSKKNQMVNARVTILKKPGILYNEEKNTKTVFNPGDYMICIPTGDIRVMRADEANGTIRKSSDTSAMCDSYLEKAKMFAVEFLGSSKQFMSPNIVSKWAIADIVN